MADRLRVTELDFDQIKNNLKTFLNQQTEFTDYDFEGSGLNILLDILAYNTHYNAYYLNMVANESFLDTSLLRDSVVSHAKTLGYVPYSQRAPIATVNFTAQSSSNTLGSLTIPSGFSFLSNQIDNTSYNFVVLDEITVAKANNQYYFENLDIYEGQLVTYAFNHNQATNPKQVFTLPDANIDTTTIKVTSVPAAGNTQVTVYQKVTDVLDITTSSEVFYLQENKSGKFQIYFGNDIVGKKLPDGAIVSITYLVTNGTASNKANNFIATATLIDSISEGINNFIITPISAASGGAERESIDEIKFGAPAQFTTQNRLVTFKDYESYIKKNYPSIDSLSVWGGEDEIPPVYGKVFVSFKPKGNYYISETEKQRIIDEIIKPKSVISIETLIKDPEYLYIKINNNIRYNSKKSIITEEALRTLINNTIINYFNLNVSKFNSTFALSKMQEEIDNLNDSIIGIDSTLRLEKKFKPLLLSNVTYTVNFNSELYRGSVINRLESNQFDVFDNTGTRRTAIIEETPEAYTGISSIIITNPGSGYTSTPTVTIIGDGSGATATAKIVSGRVESFTITNRGINYSRAILTITGGGGFGAAATIILDSRFGTLRTAYFDSNAERQIIDANAGTINYDTGEIILNNLQVLSTSSADGYININVESENNIIGSVKNTLIVLDSSDPSSIVTSLTSI